MEKYQIQIHNETDEIPYDLLLLADPSKENIDRYILDSEIWKIDINGRAIACYVLFTIDEETVEIKNVAVETNYQGKGLGTRLLKDAIEKSKQAGFNKLSIGTGNSSIGQLYLYQKVVFRITEIKTDFFTKNYRDPIVENGIRCRDMIVLTKMLKDTEK